MDSHSNPTLLWIRLKYSKTYQKKQGVDLFVGRTFTNLCPIAATLALRGQTEGPLFMKITIQSPWSSG